MASELLEKNVVLLELKRNDEKISSYNKIEKMWVFFANLYITFSAVKC